MITQSVLKGMHQISFLCLWRHYNKLEKQNQESTEGCSIVQKSPGKRIGHNK